MSSYQMRDIADSSRAAARTGDIGGVRRTHVALFSGTNTFDPGVTRELESGRVLGYGAQDVI